MMSPHPSTHVSSPTLYVETTIHPTYFTFYVHVTYCDSIKLSASVVIRNRVIECIYAVLR